MAIKSRPVEMDEGPIKVTFRLLGTRGMTVRAVRDNTEGPVLGNWYTEAGIYTVYFDGDGPVHLEVQTSLPEPPGQWTLAIEYSGGVAQVSYGPVELAPLVNTR